ncbi:unnamed protein product [Leptosia nina]|uniref:Lipocalin/cytosolic fatty-acid binding domain-containing protein n=1 Tax=Leptosia nina TaxID=320188 RepID=A0AAV1JNC5_9NEOP
MPFRQVAGKCNNDLMMLKLFICVLCISLSSAQILQNGRCESINVSLPENFQLGEFAGTWYHIEGTRSPLQTGDCSTLSITARGDILTGSNTLDVKIKSVDENFPNEITGVATVQNGSPSFSVNYPTLSKTLDLNVMITDYENFALAYSCENFGSSQKNLYFWQLGRSSAFPTEMIKSLMNRTLYVNFDVTTSDLTPVDHSDVACHILPEIAPGESIILPGQCDQNITAVQNFQGDRFQGVWHQIVAYYSTNSMGQCNRAEYSFSDGKVDKVINSEVIEEKLRTITGSAIVSSDDGSAKLLVTLEVTPGNFVDQPLWILATDYTNYAVSYSCSDLSDNRKRVTSWILSRKRQMPESVQPEVDLVIKSYKDLNRAYYLQTNQSDSACFYYPDTSPGQSVVFPGQCDDSIEVVQDFQAAKYLGLWHNIESYPSVNQEGTCNNARYSLAEDGSVDVFNTQVINETLLTINGVATLSENANTAKLTVQFPIPGTNRTTSTNYWVLATDYESFAFVYSCTNINEYERKVFGWKLSRTKQLPPNANTIIEGIMNNVPVLRQRYFEKNDQTGEGCFYYPAVEPGVPVVFPGQCDENIPVINNFQANLFSGDWYEIQAYPKEFQPGQCVNHKYTLAGGDLNIESSSVNNQFLITSNSTLVTSGTSGNLSIITPGPNDTTITIPFWILSVDYQDYALAYSCVNLVEDKRAIYSWKLSRRKELSSAANTAIDNAIADIVVLDNKYYEPIDQSDNACFYLPDLAPGEPVILLGKCDSNIQAIQNFNVSAYLGRWRLLESYPAEQQKGTCNTAQYSIQDNDSVKVDNSQVVTEELEIVTGSATAASDGSGKITVTFPNSPTPADIWVLDTDYTSYSLVYACNDLPDNKRRVYSWKLSRGKELTTEAVLNINKVIENVQVLNNRYYEKIDHSDDGCFYFPAAGTDPVVFPGQCDVNIPVVTTFNASEYLGLWHNIESYPSTFQTGTCGNALYSSGTTSAVDVYNTQVIDRKLDSIRGTADFAEAINVGKLTVSFPIAGTNRSTSSSYWILATDYENYALVYSCVNLNEETRRVSSWKLSRTKSLSNVATNAINAVVATIPVLSERYYAKNNQSAESCFYFPEPEPGKVVEFPGKCDDTIQAYPNFNLTLFGGTWYEIQAYPKEQQTGQCIRHDYSVAGNDALNLVSSNVLNEALRETNSNVRFASAQDTSGKLIIRINSGGSEVQIPFWILDIDYSDYALAYSCVNVENDRRRVFSWKLSRSKTLSSAAAIGIDAAIKDIDVIDNKYYEAIDQSDSACFYLPDISLGESVIFPGQCDVTIPVVQNFNVTRYGGRWRMIETYYSDFQNGECNDATYSLLEDGTVSALNTQVIGTELDSITGNATLASTDGSAKLLVRFPTTTEASDYWILDTDYDTYSLVYSCRNLDNNRRRVWSWKLSRSKELSTDANNKINTIINSINVLNSKYYKKIDHSDDACFYLPTPDGKPVVFRGLCDETIPVVANFRATDYLNLWHNIESYPSAFQTGTCNNAFYSPGTTTAVDVYNTQVINRTLDSIRGTADIAENANTGKLVVSFPIAGTNLTTSTPYWILGTDYTSYALVYTCMNLDEDSRRVSSWKLSRTKSLTSEATTAINTIVNRIPVLDQKYYEKNDQSAEGCFYFPEPEPGKVVEFPGKCDETIQAYPNFNLTLFGGTWYEIQAYPKEQQTGQCIRHDYSVAGNDALNLVSSNVLNEALRETNSNVRFASAQDTSGKLIISINSGGSEVQIPFWILDIDYSDYALAYSCVNVENDRRRVFSWKLSRSKTLSSAAAIGIDAAIKDIDVIDNKYYEAIDQSDFACFYLPDIPLGESVIFPGQCDVTIPVVQNFNVTRYGGRWRMIETYYSDFQNGECNDATYSLLEDDTVSALNTQVIGTELDSITGNATLASTDGSAKLLVRFPTTTEASDYWILDTDYDTYSLVYSCRNLDNNRRRVWSWKLSRSKELSTDANNKINTIINSINVLNSRYYKKIDHSDDACFYLPVPDGKPVIFRGLCDETIPVVTNFRATDYLNLWHNIESYPSAFQTGTCNNAFYSPGTTTAVDVYNTQVINRTLDSIRGTADIAKSANTGKLIVTFPIAGTNRTTATDYWILDTDYTSYALVYTCNNLEDESRRVSSWKLSRTKVLSSEAANKINAVVARIPVLNQQYYEKNDQSDEGCFYFPDPEPGKVVEFPGRCDESIQAEPNFNLTLFRGTWYEIQAYPKEQQTGQCIRHDYSVAGSNTLDLVSSNVLNEALRETNSNVRFASAQDTSGKLIIRINSGGSEVQIPFWVLDTDYNDYALAYSCVNVENDRRRVFSWKLSRSKILSAEGDRAISDAMQNIDVIDKRYFENIDQSDSACFYLPDVPMGSPVVFPGQCDLNIPVVRDFNVTAYGGRWRMIETYASEFQIGECNDATYTLLDDGSVLVLNTQVINQDLDTITGNATLGSDDGSAKLFVKFPTTIQTADYWVLDTDYTSYALVYSCRNLDDNRRRVWSWKLSRSTELSGVANNNINAIINNINVLNSKYFKKIDHSDKECFYYPIPDGKPVLYRGQCDETISVINNFNAANYLGTWYDIESYPTNYQFGTCPTARYTLNGDRVDVFNTEVINQRLSTVNGVAVPYPDGSSRLTVSFPIPGTQESTSTPYWVLDTDYRNYALVYSCVNDGSEHRKVSSWKLSRQKTLSPASIAAINIAMGKVDVIDERYFNVRNHTDEMCFFYPENNGGPVELDGECATDSIAISNFDVEAFNGAWYEVSRYPSELVSGQCVSNEFVASNQNAFTMKKSYVSDEALLEVTGTATVATDGRGILNVRLTEGSGASFETTMYVMDVNYTDYALLYGCRSLGNGKKQIYSWKLSRSQEGLSPEAENNIQSIVTETKDLWEGYYEITDQTYKGCFHYPEFDETPDVIELIGPCDETIKGVANFNASAYLGKWYELASYPQRFQNGECSRAYYSTDNGAVVNVMNTQVVNRTLDVAYATATVASNDGSGVLDVTFTMPVSTTSNYYILATDYTRYALVYSCRNLDNRRRQVGSWKLSRDKTLSSDAETIMNDVINKTQGLNPNYYIPTSQSEDSCFYVPDADKNEAPTFRGQCQDVSGVQGFNTARFLGWWHEIENYPTGTDTGSCISSDFLPSGNSYQVVDTSVRNNSASVITSAVTFTNDGKIRKTLSDGKVIDILVLATDYDSFALLYTCENINTDYKRVWSAKYSRTRELTQHAQSIIDSYMNNNRVLEPKFYFLVDQSDSVCFHYPEISGDQVILPGQCDTNIPVKKQFDPAQYSGTWYQIERYPQRFESGNCTGARYRLNTGTGVVTVLNWQVIDGVLDSVEGTATVNSTDGSAKLIVNLPVRGTDDPEPQMVSMELFVLDTDYISYSLAYSCVNDGHYRRAVGVWKLSRTRSLTEAGNTAINTYTAGREEFNDKYYLKIGQNETCPEPSSGVLAKSSIIVLIISIALSKLF